MHVGWRMDKEWLTNFSNRHYGMIVLLVSPVSHDKEWKCLRSKNNLHAALRGSQIYY